MVTPLFTAFLKCLKHNYQLDQILENFIYPFYFDGISLNAETLESSAAFLKSPFANSKSSRMVQENFFFQLNSERKENII